MKREFQRFCKVKVLDDPGAMIKRLLLPDNVEFQERTPDSVFIRQALVALGAAATLEQFCASIIEDVHGQPHSIRNCADEVLRDKKQIYWRFFLKIVKHLREMEDIKFLDVKGRHNMILQLSDGYFVDLCKHHSGEPSARLRHEVIRNTYMYFSYILHRALTFVKLIKGIPTKKDRNDYEDSQICMHLALDTPYSIVTDDNRMKTALKETICLLREHAMAEFQTTLNVCGFSDCQIT